MQTRSGRSTPIYQAPQTRGTRIKSEPPSPEDSISATRKRPSTSFQTEKDVDRRKGNRPRLSSPSSKLQSQVDRLEAKFNDLADKVQECVEKGEEFDSARGIIEKKLCDDEETPSKFSGPKFQREVRKEFSPHIKTVTDQLAILKRGLDERNDLSGRVKELDEQVQRLVNQVPQERIPEELSTKQMDKLRQYIHEEVMRSKKDNTPPPKSGIEPRSAKRYMDEGKASEIKNALQNLQDTFDRMLEHILVSKEGECVNE